MSKSASSSRWEGLRTALGFGPRKRAPGLRTLQRKTLSIEPLEQRQLLAVLYWDANGNQPGVGGTGTWDATTANWRIGNETGDLTTWTNGDDAVFAGTAGTVTIDSGGVSPHFSQLG